MDELVGIKEEPIDEIDSRQEDNVYASPSNSNAWCNAKAADPATVVFKIEEIEVKEEPEQILYDAQFLDESSQITEITENGIDFNGGKFLSYI